MRIIDTHCHASPYWYEPVESLLFHMDRNQVEKAVLVQYMGQYNNRYQSECVRRYPDRLVSVVLVDTDRTDAVDELQRLAEEGAAGVRLYPQTRSPGDDPLAIWRKAEELGLPVTVGGTADGFAAPDFAQIVEAVPNVPIIIEHLGSINQPDGEPSPYTLRRQVFALARYANVYIKVHGLGEICRRTNPVQEPFPFEREELVLLDMAYEAFGPTRIMWGSDFPPVSRREGYANALQWTLDEFRKYGEEACRLIFGEVATQVYRLDR